MHASCDYGFSHIRHSKKRKQYKSPLPEQEEVDSDPPQLLSPKRKKLNLKSLLETSARLDEMQSHDDYEQMTREMQKESAKNTNQNDDHVSTLLKVKEMEGGCNCNLYHNFTW